MPSTTECPDCGHELSEQEISCPSCGWPHEEKKETAPKEQQEPGAEKAPGPAPAGGTSPRNTLLIGLAIGLVLGFFFGRIWPRKETPEAARPHTGAPLQNPSPARPDSLKLRELQWRQSSPGFCTGLFEVVSAPPSVRGLRFSVMDAQGKVIGRDKVSAPKGIKPNSVLELGFEAGKCADIQKWHVQIIEK
jgi:hypothetical protein